MTVKFEDFKPCKSCSMKMLDFYWRGHSQEMASTRIFASSMRGAKNSGNGGHPSWTASGELRPCLLSP